MPNDIIKAAGSNGAPSYLGGEAALVIIAYPGTAKGGIWNLLLRDPPNGSTGDEVTDLAAQKHKDYTDFTRCGTLIY